MVGGYVNVGECWQLFSSRIQASDSTPEDKDPSLPKSMGSDSIDFSASMV
jgi:hypothetical protein